MKNLFLKNRFLRNIGIPVLFLLFNIPFTTHAQYNIKENNVWAFGYQTGLDFSSGTPIATAPLTGLPGNSGSASVCDSSGKLLFYTNGYAVWNKNSQIMPNGDAIFSIAGRLSPFSASQGALIVPVLNNPNQYYVFSEEGTTNSPYVFGPTLGTTDSQVARLYYSVVDMTLNNGLGDVIAGKKSIPIDSGLNGSVIAIKGDQCNIWVLTHVVDQNIFKAYNITTAGIDLNPVISVTGNLTSFSKAYVNSRMRISPDQKKLGLISTGNGGGITDAGVELYDFDPATGKVSNCMSLGQIGGSGIAFSPDNSKLYVTGVVPVTYTYSLFQFDITQPTAAAIINSRQVILNTQWLDLRLAPDGKIYHIINGQNIGVINNPNLSGTACNYVANVIVSPGPPSTYQFGSYFPNEYVKVEGGSLDTLHSVDLDTLVCPDFGDLTLHAVSGAKAYLWDNGSNDSVRTITEAGTYYVRSAVDFCTNRVDTFVVGTYDVPQAVINVSGFVLGTAASYSTYQWILNGNIISGATDSTYTVTENGIYTVVVTTENGCSDTSAPYEVSNVTGINDLGNVAAQIKVYPNPADNTVYISAPVPVRVKITSLEGKLIREVTDATSISVKDLSAGLYLLRVTDKKGNLIKVEKLIKKR